jgi:hypothetical protein
MRGLRVDKQESLELQWQLAKERAQMVKDQHALKEKLSRVELDLQMERWSRWAKYLAAAGGLMWMLWYQYASRKLRNAQAQLQDSEQQKQTDLAIAERAREKNAALADTYERECLHLIDQKTTLEHQNTSLEVQKSNLEEFRARWRTPSWVAKNFEEIPANLVCVITGEPFQDPVTCADGHSYERAAIEDWFKRGHRTSPLTNEDLQHMNLLPNHALRGAVEEFLEAEQKQPGFSTMLLSVQS